MKLATRDQLLTTLGRPQRRYRNVELPVSGLTVRVQSLTEGELSRYQRRLLKKDGRGIDPTAIQAANRHLFVACLVNDDNGLMLSASEADTLADMDCADASKLYQEIQDHLGVDPTDLGETEKNSNSENTPCAATKGGSSPSD
jgi:hypothetical protein